MSSTRSTGALIATLVIGAALGAGAAMALRGGDARLRGRITAAMPSPDKSIVALATATPCAKADAWCTELRIGPSTDASKVAAAYDDPSAVCDEVVWTPDGTRVGFVMRGYELRLFDPQSLKEIGTVRLVTEEAAQTRRARGVTFSENGRAVTFDDCPRAHSGCRAGVAGVPQ
ncbi:MAG TPA: hypothetical protein VH740_05950 [Vicinamibacterales bacterium]